MDVECVFELTDTQIEAWRAFLAEADHAHPRQDLRYADVERASGYTPFFAIGREDGRIQAVGLFSLRHHKFGPWRFAEALAPSGPVCDDPDQLCLFLSKLVALPAFPKVQSVKVTPYWLDSEAETLTKHLVETGWVLLDPLPFRETGVLDLTPDRAEMLAAFSRSARRKVRLAEKAGIEVRPLASIEEARTFLASLNEMTRRNHLPQVDPVEYEAAFEHIFTDPAIGTILGAFKNRALLGGILMYRSHRSAHGRRYTADQTAVKTISNLRIAPILWLEGMVWAKEHGCTLFDLEGYRKVENDSDPKFNVYTYKGEFKPSPVRRIGEHALILNPIMHYITSAPAKAKTAVKRAFPALSRINTLKEARVFFDSLNRLGTLRRLPRIVRRMRRR